MKRAISSALIAALLATPTTSLGSTHSPLTQDLPQPQTKNISKNSIKTQGHSDTIRINLTDGSEYDIAFSSSNTSISVHISPLNERARKALAGESSDEDSTPYSYPARPTPSPSQPKKRLIGEKATDFIGRKAMRSLKTPEAKNQIATSIIDYLVWRLGGPLPFLTSITLQFVLTDFIEKQNQFIDDIVDDKTNRGIRVITKTYKEDIGTSFDVHKEIIKCPLLNPPNLYAKCQSE